MTGVCSAKISRMLRNRLVDLEPRLHEDQVRTLPLGGHRRHCRSDAELSGFLARGRHHAALAGSADRDRLAAKVRIVPLLYGSVEGVHIDVDDLSLAQKGVRLVVGLIVHVTSQTFLDAVDPDAPAASRQVGGAHGVCILIGFLQREA
jgi:hypothetical protein